MKTDCSIYAIKIIKVNSYDLHISLTKYFFSTYYVQNIVLSDLTTSEIFKSPCPLVLAF